MITYDLKKINMQVNKLLEDFFAFYNNRIWEQIQRYLEMLAFFSDNCGYLLKSRCAEKKKLVPRSITIYVRELFHTSSFRSFCNF